MRAVGAGMWICRQCGVVPVDYSPGHQPWTEVGARRRSPPELGSPGTNLDARVSNPDRQGQIWTLGSPIRIAGDRFGRWGLRAGLQIHQQSVLKKKDIKTPQFLIIPKSRNPQLDP